VAVFLVGHRLQRIGNMRFMVKKALLFVPVLGVAAYFLDFIFLSRNWNKDEQAIRRVFRSMLEGTRKRLFWICMFPEGTRITSQKLRESHEYATRKNLPILKHVLIPRVKGLHACLIGLRNEADAVLDLTVAYSVRKGETSDLGAVGRGYLANHGKIRPGLADVMLHRSAVRTWPIHIHVRVIPVAEIPTDQKGTADWLFKVFQEKDQLLDHFNTHGCFPGPPNDLPRRSVAQALWGLFIYSSAALLGALICNSMLHATSTMVLPVAIRSVCILLSEYFFSVTVGGACLIVVLSGFLLK